MIRSRNAGVWLLPAVAAILISGCAAKTDYSDANPPAATAASGQPSKQPNYSVSSGPKQFDAVKQKMKAMLGQTTHNASH